MIKWLKLGVTVMGMVLLLSACSQLRGKEETDVSSTTSSSIIHPAVSEQTAVLSGIIEQAAVTDETGVTTFLVQDIKNITHGAEIQQILNADGVVLIVQQGVLDKANLSGEQLKKGKKVSFSVEKKAAMTKSLPPQINILSLEEKE
ncbi:hypothetical protein ACWOAH_09460 [Vagococcus vulneris]|uniref:Lipoprotein n=1 Tax=Vagococcus vulneris TaxID=1977869 RepID=A0A429ZUI6_9ENTE|nr:hypothetical protein [Vagococcus vulneris]RST97358.1 hypothetical protein CBF37_09760 [Vagococcus vulneris]